MKVNIDDKLFDDFCLVGKIKGENQSIEKLFNELVEKYILPFKNPDTKELSVKKAILHGEEKDVRCYFLYSTTIFGVKYNTIVVGGELKKIPDCWALEFVE